ncbi:zinc knuckle CX2CX4HX4C [Artemisia annua]|uniref:Zinc knuckle CX2CX4HX4C n=1 Tax=Artemisia annua TaxID=35608 RepID=A0A2U1LQZ7_ARTAN|nr:zinc knuckle CX2CX4HX4C [Artemisia annua]
MTSRPQVNIACCYERLTVYFVSLLFFMKTNAIGGTSSLYPNMDVKNLSLYRYRKKWSKEEICRKKVKVEFDWYPPRCAICCIFGHNDQKCGKKNNEEVNTKPKEVNSNNEKNMNDGFEEVRYRKNGIKGDGKRQQFQNNENGKKMQPKPVEKFAYKPKTNATGVANNKTEKVNVNMEGLQEKDKEKQHSPKKAWHVQGELLAELKKSANKYSVLEMYDVNEESELVELENKEVVEEFLRQKKELSEVERNSWNLDMIAYYKQRKKQIMDAGEGSSMSEKNDVLVDKTGIAQCMEEDELKGLDTGILGKKN